jgi:ATP dependent DNA ligase C terminal region
MRSIPSKGFEQVRRERCVASLEPQRSLRCHFAFMSASAGYPRFKVSSTPSMSRSWILRLSSKATCRSASGKRTREWLKYKAVHEQEVVIVGYTEPRGSRKYFGSLVLAVRDNATKRWVYAGHVGTGFDQAALKSLYGTMQPLSTGKKPFDQKVKDEKATTWLIPKLVGEVEFTEWTSEGEMRHPAFLGLRSDNDPGVVADGSQVLGQTQCVFRVVRMYLRAAARTFRLHNYTHGSHLMLRITNGLGCLCRTQDEGDGT